MNGCRYVFVALQLMWSVNNNTMLVLPLEQDQACVPNNQEGACAIL